mmetsp:Transcript_15299/g.29662  ORF Transcript_15299/g.29662 Transcript_15299/m.29662 type:complete len:317 (+) Transcript_15299:152-1102(+)|eukprot:CAMPEP_0171489078 /NCGR_PEP_ID=MMETSP0958-20121227/2554_1 /TAXON_ID=87120 /ORGANISM="Aurantiochytrium limacinum, Strain ATCCMYA-1381" /LENGTH=316 /DNA_ID=CAMNT_0012022245 /DNA_START=86 /DNA_END=1036 /DNA_ORIENTATION=+
MQNESRAREGLRDFLGLDGEQLDGLLAHLRTQSAGEIRAYLGALLPDTPPIRAFIGQIIGESASKSKSAPPPPPPVSTVSASASSVSKSTKSKKKKGSQGDNESTGASGATRKTKSSAKSPSSSSAVAASPSRTPEEQALFEKRKRNRKIITGNEEARRNPAVQNCLECGMIYYTEEYSKMSRCAYCDDPLGKGQAKRAQDRQQEQDEAFSRALAHRDKLLDFDATSAARTKVYDDQADYFEMDLDVMDSKWATTTEKEEMKAKVEARRDAEEEAARKITLTFDLAGRRIIQDSSIRGTAAGAVYDSIAAALAASQ